MSKLKTPTEAFIKEVEAYCKADGITEETLGRYVRNNKDMMAGVRSLEERARDTMDKARTWMVANPPGTRFRERADQKKASAA